MTPQAPGTTGSDEPVTRASNDGVAVASTGRAAGAAAGVAGGAVALGLAELGGGLLAGMPSLLDAVAGWSLQFLPGALVTWGIETFGEADRAVVAGLITVVILVVGAVAGMAHAHRPRASAWTFCVVALVGTMIAAGDINASLPVVAMVTGASAALGWITTARLVAVRTPVMNPRAVPDSRMDRPGADTPVADMPTPRRPALVRRDFLTAVGAVTGVAAVAGWGGRRLSLGGGSPSGGPAAAPDSLALPAPATPLTDAPGAASFELEGLTPLYVPNDDFYRIDTAFSSVPQIDVETWSMRIHGHVRNELTLTMDDLLARDLVEADVTIACVSNEVGGGLIGNARWLGVRLDELLEEAGVLDSGTQVVGRSVDGWTAGFPTEIALDGRDAIVAVGMNDEPLPVEHGFPARLIVPGLYGYVSATKWLSDIELLGWDEFDGYWVPRGWSKRGPIKTQSRIDTVVPAADGGMVAGGIAWAQPRGVARVEVRVDDGAFFDAELAEAISDVTWVQWRAPLEVAPGRHVLTVRATDNDGVTQPEAHTPEHPNGAEGWHSLPFDA